MLERPTEVRAEIQPLPNVTVDRDERSTCTGLKRQHRNFSAPTGLNEKTKIIFNMHVYTANPPAPKKMGLSDQDYEVVGYENAKHLKICYFLIQEIEDVV